MGQSSSKNKSKRIIYNYPNMINIVFLRHGYGCHNIRNQTEKQTDPSLTKTGIYSSALNGNLIYTAMNKIFNPGFTFDFIGASPAIRSIENSILYD